MARPMWKATTAATNASPMSRPGASMATSEEGLGIRDQGSGAAPFLSSSDPLAGALPPDTTPIRGIPTPADILTVLDNMAGLLSRPWSIIRRADPAEAGTIAAYVRGMNRRIRGDGGTLPGLTHQGLKNALRDPLSRFIALLRYDTLYRSPDLAMFTALENAISSNLPSWKDAN